MLYNVQYCTLQNRPVVMHTHSLQLGKSTDSIYDSGIFSEGINFKGITVWHEMKIQKGFDLNARGVSNTNQSLSVFLVIWVHVLALWYSP